jgi:hypothetical protein
MRRLHQAIVAVCPIVGVAVGAPGDPESVTIDYAPEATADQRTAALNVVATFDWSGEAEATWRTGQEVRRAGLLLASTDPIPVGVRATLRVIVDHCNEQFRRIAAGQAPEPLLEADLLERVAEGLGNGLGLPVRPGV